MKNKTKIIFFHRQRQQSRWGRRRRFCRGKLSRKSSSSAAGWRTIMSANKRAKWGKISAEAAEESTYFPHVCPCRAMTQPTSSRRRKNRVVPALLVFRRLAFDPASVELRCEISARPFPVRKGRGGRERGGKERQEACRRLRELQSDRFDIICGYCSFQKTPCCFSESEREVPRSPARRMSQEYAISLGRCPGEILPRSSLLCGRCYYLERETQRSAPPLSRLILERLSLSYSCKS